MFQRRVFFLFYVTLNKLANVSVAFSGNPARIFRCSTTRPGRIFIYRQFVSKLKYNPELRRFEKSFEERISAPYSFFEWKFFGRTFVTNPIDVRLSNCRSTICREAYQWPIVACGYCYEIRDRNSGR